MSDLKLISPLLDHFMVGEAISNHDGVQCYPAMREDADDKYILKIISIPASPIQLDALLLTGAYSSNEAALNYYKELAEDVAREASVLQKLSRLEGFLEYEGWQIEPKNNGCGFDVYLLGSYKRTLEKHLKRNAMTHLSAINLGLDLCSALAVCRRAGCLYIDLQPSNIFIGSDGSFRIGDLGLIPLDSLKYASLPEKYHNYYTAPEITDAFSTLNTTMDIYAAGLILYQVYNGGQLPLEGESVKHPLPAPFYADYEMTEIILKACALNAEDRWQNPSELGQALVGYMQRNGVNDTPIIPVAPECEASNENIPDAELQPDEQSAEAKVDEEKSVTDDKAEHSDRIEEPAGDNEPVTEDSSDLDDSIVSDAETAPDGAASSDDITDLSFIQDMVSDETAPSEENTATLQDTVVSQETSDILAQAEELIAHQAPEPVIAPEPVEIVMPEPEQSEVTSDEEDSGSDKDETFTAEDDFASESRTEDSQTENSIITNQNDAENLSGNTDSSPKNKKKRGWMIAVLIALLAAVSVGYYFYQNYYLLPIENISLDASKDQLTVTVEKSFSDENLIVVCTDAYGNVKTSSLQDGVAHFEKLSPNTHYDIRIKIDGFHKLTGKTETAFVSEQCTQIMNFSAVTGPQDGSVILNFTVDGHDPKQWTVAYQAEGEEEKTITSEGRNITINDLTVGKEYRFRLLPDDTSYMTGVTEITHTAQEVVLAQSPEIKSCKDGVMLLTWTIPDGKIVDEWVVHCYNQKGYDQTVRVNGTEATFSNIQSSDAYAVDIQAGNMTASVQIMMSANAITVTDVASDFTYSPKLYLQWGFVGPAPEGGWVITATADGSNLKEVVTSEKNEATLSEVIPGTRYHILLAAANETTVFNHTFIFDAPAAKSFDGYWINQDALDFQMCHTPEKENWDRYDLNSSDYTNTFHVGDKASLLGHIERNYASSEDSVSIMLVIRNAQGIPLTVTSQTRSWNNMWSYNYGGFDIPTLPSEIGNYSIDVYFNSMLAGTESFSIT